ncbi:MAG: hypothetical protein HKN00_13650, partial [Flavobacteriaceae bacterium]|nr:hypothetical protein [Flavobacteriaceae bacterium]
MGYIQILSGINAEPKLWVLLFSILGMQAFYNQKWFLTGLFFCLAAMSWQVAVVSLFACFLCLPWRSERLWKSLTRLAAGVLSGIIPIVLYLTITNQWVDFWDLAVLRKLVVEGEQVGESPLSWIRKGIYPHFLLEGFHFLLSLGGIVVVFINMIRKKGPGKNSSENRFLIFLIIYSIFWSGFNTLDFQSAADLLPLIPAVIFFGAIM